MPRRANIKNDWGYAPGSAKPQHRPCHIGENSRMMRGIQFVTEYKA